ncbi:MAG TPA: tRNA adenosine(34) deaminase TadA [Microbacteriaceae bacterium]|nr:tRNA adenosine(34) deaminase TadA [Microbacteriaceae bacterium]
MDRYRAWMAEALELARGAEAAGDVPVGAVVVDREGRVVGRGRNAREARYDPTAHAEIVAIREAGDELGSWRLDGCTLVVTLEPCVMCAGAVLQSRIRRLVFGAWDEKAGAVGGRIDVVREAGLPHSIEVVPGIAQAESSAMLRRFFERRR